MKDWFDRLPYRILRWYYLRDLKKVRNILAAINTNHLPIEVSREITQAEHCVMRASFDLISERINEKATLP